MDAVVVRPSLCGAVNDNHEELDKVRHIAEPSSKIMEYAEDNVLFYQEGCPAEEVLHTTGLVSECSMDGSNYEIKAKFYLEK